MHINDSNTMKLRGGVMCYGAQALLEMEAVPAAEFEPEVLACLPQAPWAISREELARRRDLRSTRHACIVLPPKHHKRLVAAVYSPWFRIML